MPSYSELLLFFYIYSFLGWIWESGYVSIKERKPVNRGFLRGPLLPIYGCGAVMILLATYPFQNSIPLVYISGMIGATILEYITGTVMETLFKVRYWDYSTQPLNFQGQICLSSSIAWGFFSVLLTKSIHPFVCSYLLLIPHNFEMPVIAVVSVLFLTDSVVSFYAAMDLRRILESLSSFREDMNGIYSRLQQVMESAQTSLQGRMDSVTSSVMERFESLRFDEMPKIISEKIESLSSRVSSESREELANIEGRFSAQKEFYQRIQKRFTVFKKQLLRGNPMITSSKYGDALKYLKDSAGVTHRVPFSKKKTD